MQRKRLPILSIVPVGTVEFPRFMITDSEDRLWNGTAFGEIGLIYAGYNEAATDCQRILRAQFTGLKPQVFVAPCVVEVFSDQPIQIAKVARHLSRSARLHLDTPKHGHGPDGAFSSL